MPKHVHVLPLPKTSLPVILRWWKGSTARLANLILSRTGEAFLQDESFDHCVRDEAELDRLVGYVEYHPVSAGLAANPRAWRWSSARLAGESACHNWPDHSRNVETPGSECIPNDAGSARDSQAQRKSDRRGSCN